MKTRPRIVVIGSLVFDFVAKAERLPRKGETVLGEMFGMFPGGKGANQAVQAGRLGAEVYMVGRIGDDFLADSLLASLAESGVATEFVKPTPRSRLPPAAFTSTTRGTMPSSSFRRRTWLAPLTTSRRRPASFDLPTSSCASWKFP